jgi:hypothetical protein
MSFDRIPTHHDIAQNIDKERFSLGLDSYNTHNKRVIPQDLDMKRVTRSSDGSWNLRSRHLSYLMIATWQDQIGNPYSPYFVQDGRVA